MIEVQKKKKDKKDQSCKLIFFIINPHMPIFKYSFLLFHIFVVFNKISLKNKKDTLRSTRKMSYIKIKDMTMKKLT